MIAYAMSRVRINTEPSGSRWPYRYFRRAKASISGRCFLKAAWEGGRLPKNDRPAPRARCGSARAVRHLLPKGHALVLSWKKRDQ